MENSDGDSKTPGSPADAIYLTLQAIAVVANGILFSKYIYRKFPNRNYESHLATKINYADTRHHEDDDKRHEDYIELLEKTDKNEDDQSNEEKNANKANESGEVKKADTSEPNESTIETQSTTMTE